MKSGMIMGSVTLSALVALALSVDIAANAAGPASPELQYRSAPVTELKIISSGPVVLDWHGHRYTGDRVGLCIGSSTGRYRLNVRVSGAYFPRDAEDLPLRLNFQGPDGNLRSIELTHQTNLQLTGAVDPDERCRGQANGSLEFVLPFQAALAAVSGEYSKRLELEVEAD